MNLLLNFSDVLFLDKGIVNPSELALVLLLCKPFFQVLQGEEPGKVLINVLVLFQPEVNLSVDNLNALALNLLLEVTHLSYYS